MTVLPVDGQVLPIGLPPIRGLSAEELGIVQKLDAGFLRQRYEMQLSEAYYLGTQRVKNLRISVPAVLEFLQTIVGWPAFAVDPYVERLAIDGFRLPGATEVDELLSDLALATNLEGSLPLAITDALALGRGFWLVGTDPANKEIPKVTVESPLNMTVSWDLTGTRPTAAWQTFWQDGRYHGVLMLPNQTITVATNDQGNWVVADRDEHNLGFVPLVRMPHMPRSNARDGRSAITPAVRSITDSACRDLLGLEVSREFYSVPRITMLGATESDFINSDGTPKTAWETMITRFNAFERDEEGNLPEIHQTQAYDPSVFTKLLDMRASQASSLLAAPPQDLGLYTSGNPTSADAVGAMETRRARRAKNMQASFGQAIAEVQKIQIRLLNKGVLPPQYEHITTEWMGVEDESWVSSSNAISIQVTAGVVPPKSDVVLRKLGYTALERRRLEQDREAQADETAAQQIIAANQPQQGQVTGGQPKPAGN